MVWFASSGSNNSRRVHTDPDCEVLQHADTVRQKPRSAVAEHNPVCRYCTGEAGRGGSSGPQLATALAKMSPDDVGLSPLDEEVQKITGGEA